MLFIGIVTDKKNEEYVQKELSNKLNQKERKFNFININDKTIVNIKNIKFETIFINNNNLINKENEQILKKILKSSKYLVLNTDLKENLSLLEGLELIVISYGLNLKATITASSIKSDELLICIQRNIKNIKNEIIEPKEINIKTYKKYDTFNLLGMATLLILYGYYV